MEKLKTIAIIVLIGCMLLLCNHYGGVSEKVVVKTDTVTVTRIDTIKDLIPVEKIVYRRVVDTMHVYTSDTVYIVLDREQRVYESDQYKAYVSGYRPVLDSIHVYNKVSTVYIETERVVKQKPKRFGVGVQVGYGLTGHGVAPYIGIGVQYNVISF